MKTANEIRNWHNTVPANVTPTLFQSMVLEEIAAQLAEQNVLTATLVELHTAAHRRVDELDRQLCAARLETEKCKQEYYRLAAKSDLELWCPKPSAPEQADAGKDGQ